MKISILNNLIQVDNNIPVKLILFGSFLIFISCKLNDEVVNADEFSRLVIVDSLGVTGADGAISFPLTNGTSVFMMGDSFLESVENNARDVKSKMINNTFVIVDKLNNSSKSIFKGTLEDPETMLVPQNKDHVKEYYWPGHGFEYNNQIHLFMSRFTHNTNDPNDTWGFTFMGTDYLKLEKNSYDVVLQEDVPYSGVNGVHYGHSIIKEEDYIYLYGSKVVDDQASLHVARAKMNDDNAMGNYEFFSDNGWDINPLGSVALAGIHKEVPEQFSVFELKEQYVLVLQERNLTSGNIYSYISDSPVGPWTNEKFLYHTTDQEKYKDVFTYNAMAHPQFIENSKLLISYCVNSFKVPKIHENVNLYRPKFIWVPLNMIFE
jgi:hypothetical protein